MPNVWIMSTQTKQVKSSPWQEAASLPVIVLVADHWYSCGTSPLIGYSHINGNGNGCIQLVLPERKKPELTHVRVQNFYNGRGGGIFLVIIIRDVYTCLSLQEYVNLKNFQGVGSGSPPLLQIHAWHGDVELPPSHYVTAGDAVTRGSHRL